MRFWYDLEFIENGRTIDLISIGMVAEDGRELYLQSSQFHEERANQWVRENVLPHLVLCPCCGDQVNHENGKCRHAACPWRTRKQIRQELLAFCDPEQHGKPELWGYYAAYDHVALCQLFGKMIDLPKGWPMYTRDIKQLCDDIGNPPLPEQGKGEHHALADARWNKTTWKWLIEQCMILRLYPPSKSNEVGHLSPFTAYSLEG